MEIYFHFELTSTHDHPKLCRPFPGAHPQHPWERRCQKRSLMKTKQLLTACRRSERMQIRDSRECVGREEYKCRRLRRIVQKLVSNPPESFGKLDYQPKMELIRNSLPRQIVRKVFFSSPQSFRKQASSRRRKNVLLNLLSMTPCHLFSAEGGLNATFCTRILA